MVKHPPAVKGIRRYAAIFSNANAMGGSFVRNLCTLFGCMDQRGSEKRLQVSNMGDWPTGLKTAVLHRVWKDGSRKVWTPEDFLDLGSRDAVDKTLQRLTKAQLLRRIDRGLYYQPGFNKLTQKPNLPDPRSVIEALDRRDLVRMLVDGRTAANDLGLTDAVLAKVVVHSDARRRALQLGNVTISFRPTAARKLFWAGRPAMRVIQALDWMRDLFARTGEADQLRYKLCKLLADPMAGPALRANLLDGMTTLPTWMRVFLKTVIEGDGTAFAKRAVDDDHRRSPDAARRVDEAERSRARASAAKRPSRATRAEAEIERMNPANDEVLSAGSKAMLSAFDTTATGLGTTPQDVEKNFWVCWTLTECATKRGSDVLPRS